MFYWIKTNRFIKRLFPNFVWAIPNVQNKIYLSFDDGPTPEITEWVLNELEKFHAKATFFCIGNNIKKYPEIFEKIISKNHVVGNHTFNHLNGWKTTTAKYIENSIQWSEVSDQFSVRIGQRKSLFEFDKNCKLKTENCQLFRPPYGKIKPSQAKALKKLGYKIIMWDVLSADFDISILKEKCLENVVKNTKSGSIIVFHDSIKAFKNLEYVLPKALKMLTEKGFVFDVID